MISFDQACAIIASLARPIGTEDVAIGEANGRILAAPVIASVASPPCAVSSMDGYAVRDADLADLPATLPVATEIFAGAADPDSLEAGTCARIFTGAPCPPGADRVVIQEVVSRDGAAARFTQPLSTGRNIRPRGSDFSVGTVLVEAGCRLGARELVAAAGGDHATLPCWRRPMVSIIATGDELVPPGEARVRPGAIPECVSVGVAAMVSDWGGSVVAIRRVSDTLSALEQAAGLAIGEADLVVVTGGASVGEKDFARQMFEPQGLSLHVAKVAMKPGKPVWLGQCGSTLVIGLPGNPTSAMTTARLLLAPLLAGLSGRDPSAAWCWNRYPLAAPLAGTGDRETFARGSLENGMARPLTNQDSGARSTLAAADLLIRVLPHADARDEGEWVEALAF